MMLRLQVTPVRNGDATEAPVTGQIFVLGTPRSGTTWVANLLASHPSIAAVSSPLHHGVHESHVFDHTRYVLKGVMTCEHFIEQYQAEDYFQLTGLRSQEFCHGDPRDDAVGFFSRLMDMYAARAGASWWLEKTPNHTIYADEILARFPHAKLVVTYRDVTPTLASQLVQFPRRGAPRWLQVAEKAFRYHSDVRAMKRVRREGGRRPVAVVHYEQLVADPSGGCRRMLGELGIPNHPLSSAFPPVSSNAGMDKDRRLARRDRFVASMTAVATSAIPFRVLVRVRRSRDQSQATAIPKHAVLRDSGSI